MILHTTTTITEIMQRSQINPEIAQQFFESALNAKEKGQSQWFTPADFARRCAIGLPKYRPYICDLNCGAGHLLHASVNKSTLMLMGNDIDPCRGQRVKEASQYSIERITSDVCKTHELASEVGLQMPLFVLNPPFRLAFPRNHLQALASSECVAVRQAFAGVEENFHRGGIDSTVAVLLMTLDLCSTVGEGFLICNNATIERLIFKPGAPHGAVAKHIWGHVVVDGNPMTGIQDANFQHDEGEYKTGIIYFAKSHTTGPTKFKDLESVNRIYRQGEEMRDYMRNGECVERWLAVKERVKEIESGRVQTPYNVFLRGGVIETQLSRFETHSKRTNKTEADRLFKLRGKVPMQLVLARAERDELLHVVEEGGWRVDPELKAAIHAAVAAYNSERAPLYPLAEIQRLGYLDEQDEIECKLDLMFEPGRTVPKSEEVGRESSRAANPTLIFRAGQKYALRTQTVSITRTATKWNAYTGEEEELEFRGQELAILIEAENEEFCFMDLKLARDPKTEIQNVKKSPNPDKSKKAEDRISLQIVDFDLQQLCAHFIIPDVPDVATVDPEGYKRNLQFLEELEQTVNRIKESEVTHA